MGEGEIVNSINKKTSPGVGGMYGGEQQGQGEDTEEAGMRVRVGRGRTFLNGDRGRSPRELT